MTKNLPLTISRPKNGLKVRELLKFLATANPDSEVWVNAADSGFSKARVAECDVFNPGPRPVVVLR